jgi:TetR/AcrR family transcriptional repressor of nem operon
MQKGCFLVNSGIELAPHDPEIAAIVRANRQEIEEILRSAIQKGQDSGLISRKLDALSIARFFFTTISGLRVSSTSDNPDRKTLEDIIRVSLSVL